jgi:hypothetical protein
MASKTTICNQALLHLKNSKLITNVDTDNTLQSTVFLTFYDDALEEMLRAFQWPFAKRLVELAVVEEDPDDGVEWAYSYRWPSDCLLARYIVDGNKQPSRQSPRISFEVGADDTGRLILTDEPDAVLAYTASVEDVTAMSPKFRSALAKKLAGLVAPTLCGDDRTGLGPRAHAAYELEMSRAIAEYRNERQPDGPIESEFIEGR